MKTQTIPYSNYAEQNRIEMVDFYNEATEDYEFWSNDYNMHFGYFIPFKTNLFKRDSMLNEMNKQVTKRLNINKTKNRLVDLGCGMGATMRYTLKNYKNVIAYGVTLSDFQVKKGNELLKGKNGIILKENYNNTSFQSNSFDSAVAIESFCHSGHNFNSLKEMHRLLKPGGRFVMADAFLKKDKALLCKGGKGLTVLLAPIFSAAVKPLAPAMLTIPSPPCGWSLELIIFCDTAIYFSPNRKRCHGSQTG